VTHEVALPSLGQSEAVLQRAAALQIAKEQQDAVLLGLDAANKNEPTSPPLTYCWPGDIGFFVGAPANFQMNTVVDSSFAVTNPSDRTLRPIISFGVVLAPYPWLNLLFGGTYSNVQTDVSPNAPTGGTAKAIAPDLQIWTFVWGLGGPFDLASLVIGGK
jgi:hypothetical protein